MHIHICYIYMCVSVYIYICTIRPLVLKQWFSNFLMLQHVFTVSHVAVTSNHKIILDANS